MPRYKGCQTEHVQSSENEVEIKPGTAVCVCMYMCVYVRGRGGGRIKQDPLRNSKVWRSFKRPRNDKDEAAKASERKGGIGRRLTRREEREMWTEAGGEESLVAPDWRLPLVWKFGLFFFCYLSTACVVEFLLRKQTFKGPKSTSKLWKRKSPRRCQMDVRWLKKNSRMILQSPLPHSSLVDWPRPFLSLPACLFVLAAVFVVSPLFPWNSSPVPLSDGVSGVRSLLYSRRGATSQLSACHLSDWPPLLLPTNRGPRITPSFKICRFIQKSCLAIGRWINQRNAQYTCFFSPPTLSCQVISNYECQCSSGNI